MRINHNIASMGTQATLGKTGRSLAKNLEKLSNGLRINTASDDAAGLAVSENLRTQVRGLGQALKNTQDAISMLNIADGALAEQSDILHRMRELVIQAKNDTYTQTERDYMGVEFQALAEELDRIAEVTNFNGMNLFATNAITGNSSTNADPKQTFQGRNIFANQDDYLFGANDTGAATHFNMMIGGNYSQDDINARNAARSSYQNTSENMITIQFGMFDATGILATDPSRAGNFVNNVTRTGNVNAFAHDGTVQQRNSWGNNVQDKLSNLINLIDGNTANLNGNGATLINGGQNMTGFERINKQRAYIGAMTNRLEHNVNNLLSGQANQQAAESLIRDVDFASETSAFSKNQILSQSATAMLAQSNMMPQGVLRLLG